ncbi:MAG TPA: TIGR03435 family protein [Bryobacteraceae bacterium]|nr:TIGR03435 family protein [Bryobacteraceae bacterium]
MIDGLANHLWQSTVVTFVAWIFALLLGRSRASVRYGVWFGASVKFLIPFAALAALGGLVPRAAVAPVAQREWVMVAGEIGAPVSNAVPAATTRETPRHYFWPAALATWTCGFCWVVAVWMVRWRRVARVRGSARRLEGFATGVPVMTATGLLEPGVFGIFRPVLLLPEGIFQALDPAQWSAVLAHEMCHVRRRDNLTASIHMAVQAIFWFHPLVWWIGARLLEERERACDEEVVRMGNSARVYAEGILSVCKLYVESPMAYVAGVTGANLKRRIERIVAGRGAASLGFAKKTARGAAGLVVVAGPILIGIMNAPYARAQAFPPRPADTSRFEVVSVKPCKPEASRMMGGGKSSAGRLSTGCIGLSFSDNLGLIQRAYVRFGDGKPKQGFVRIVPIVGGPAWVRTEMFDIDAKAEGAPGEAMVNGPMLQLLLEDRFKLKIHREMREGPVYALTVARKSKLKPFVEGSCAAFPNAPSIPASPEGQRYCKNMISIFPPMIDAEGLTVAELGRMLELVVDRPVIDRTGLTTRFDMYLSYSPDGVTPRYLPGGDLDPARFRGRSGPAAATDPDTPPGILTAIQEQLGLKLVATRGPTDVLVIDHVERPSEN